jgi:O-antigen/teichoic acid export membrane protein
MFFSILVPLSVILGNAANLLTQVLVPRFLPPEEYTKFAVLWGVGQFFASVLFEWVRFGTLRFSVGADESLVAKRRSSLFRAYVVICLVVITLCVAQFFVGLFWSLALLGSIVAGYSVCQGVFDGVQALARAELDNKRFSVTSIVRSLLGLVFVVVVAGSTANGSLALMAVAISYPAALLSIHLLRLRGLKLFAGYSAEQMRFLAGFGLLAALSSIVTTLFPAMVRLLAAEFVGLVDAAGVVLAVDLSQKAVSVIGLAVNMLVMQKAFRSAEFGSAAEQRTRAAIQVSATTAFIFPTALGFYLIQPNLAPYLVPDAYMDIYSKNVGWACLSAAILGFRQFGLDPLFLAANRSGLAVVGPVLTIVLSALWIFVVGESSAYSTVLISSGMAFGLAGGALCSVIIVAFVIKVDWPVRDMAIVFLGCSMMGLAVKQVSFVGGVWGIVLSIIVGGFVYFVVGAALDLCGFRELLRKRLFVK